MTNITSCTSADHKMNGMNEIKVTFQHNYEHLIKKYKWTRVNVTRPIKQPVKMVEGRFSLVASEKKVLLSNQKYSDSLQSLAFCLVFFKLFREFFILNEKGLECYGLLHTPQCDKPCHLRLKRGHTRTNLCLKPLFYSIIHYT